MFFVLKVLMFWTNAILIHRRSFIFCRRGLEDSRMLESDSESQTEISVFKEPQLRNVHPKIQPLQAL